MTNAKVLFSIVAVSAITLQADEKGQHPNIIFVLADDLGIGDLEPTNPECRIKTPHL